KFELVERGELVVGLATLLDRLALGRGERREAAAGVVERVAGGKHEGGGDRQRDDRQEQEHAGGGRPGDPPGCFAAGPAWGRSFWSWTSRRKSRVRAARRPS